jgi:hypothetical protein
MTSNCTDKEEGGGKNKKKNKNSTNNNNVDNQKDTKRKATSMDAAVEEELYEIYTADESSIAPARHIRTKIKVGDAMNNNRNHDFSGEQVDHHSLSSSSFNSSSFNNSNTDNHLIPSGIKLPEDYRVVRYPLNNEDENYWGQVQHFTCMNCEERTHSYVLSIPLKYHGDIDRFEVDGRFCNFGCMRRYIVDHRDYSLPDISSLITQMAIEIYNYRSEIVIAPPPRLMEKHMGTGGLSIEQYRSIGSGKVPLVAQFIRPPFFVAPGFMVIKPTKGHKDYHHLLVLEKNNVTPSTIPHVVRFIPEDYEESKKQKVNV